MSYRKYVLAAAAYLLVMTCAPLLRAQEIVLEGPLVGQPAVRKMHLLREGRLSVTPSVGTTLLDTYRRNVFIGAMLEYSVYDWFAVGVWGVYSFNGGTCDASACTWLDTKLTKEVESKARSNVMNIPDADKFHKQVGTIQGLLTFDLKFIPLRGKLGLFKSLFLQSDFYVFIGAGVGFVKERGYASDSLSGNAAYNCRDETPADGKADDYNACMTMKSRTIAVVPSIGAGFDFFIKEWLAINIEYRGLPMKFNISGTDEYGHNASGKDQDPGYYNKKAKFPDHKIDGKDRVFTWINAINFGLSFYFTFGKTEGIFKTRITD